MRKLILILISVISVSQSFSQATTCAGATALTVNGACGGSATITDATMEGPAPTCAAGAPIREGWYIFTNSAVQNIIITGDISSRNLAIQLFSGSCAGLTQVACENSGGAGVDEVLTSNCLPIGTYYVRITNVGSNDMLLVSLCITSSACGSLPPPNDEPCSATALTVGSSCTFSTYTNANATSTAGVTAPGCANYGGGDVWFTAVVPASGAINLDGNTGVITDGGAAIYTGTCGSLTLLTCDDDSSPDDAMPLINTTGLTPGSTIFIRVWEYGNDNNGTFDLCVYNPCPPCAGSPTGGTANASNTSVCGNSTNLSLTGSSTGCGFNYQWQSSPDNSTWTNIAGATSATLTQTPVANTYYRCVITCNISGLSSNSTSVLVTFTGLVANDNCGGATPITVNSGLTCTFVSSGTVECTSTSPESTTACGGNEDDDVWFSFVATAGSQIITLQNITGSTTDLYHSLWTGTCPGLTLVPGTCSDPNTQTVAGLTIGQTYYVRVYTWTGTAGQTSDFDICITNPCPTCVGTPAGGTANASLTVVCGQTTNLSVTGSVTGCGYTYQWYYSLDNISWTIIPGATLETYAGTPNADIYYRRIVTCPASGNSGTSTSIFIDVTPGPSNDDPCNASALTVGTSCSFSTYTNTCATNSVLTVGAPTPSCTSYGGGDVWFTVTVPSGGSLTFDSNTGVIIDMGMAIYSGTCNSLTQIACDDDGSVNGNMSYIAATGLTPGSTIWVRCWEYGGDNNGTFDLCVYDPCPPCAGAPTAGTATATPNNTTCGSPNTTLTLTGGSSGCGFTYQWQSSPDNASWTNITGATSASLTTPVSVATYFRCIISCIASGQSSTSSSVLVTTTIANVCSYTISTPAYSPDAAYTAGTLLTFPDDQMSTVLPIGFSFCFMGTNYTNCVVSSNSFISFNTASAGGYSAWVTVPIPTATPVETLNSIMFPWHDIDPSVGVASDIRYLTIGSAPNRKFIVNFSLTPMYSFACNSLTYTGQLVLNETTNIIETYIQNKVVCSTWNSGNAVHGVNGPDGCSGVTVPGRNNTQWTATNDAKMFTPTGCCTVPLAAELLTFEGAQIATSLNQLNWSSATETNLDKYIIEKSENGMDFEYLSELKASGNSSSSINYSINDNKPYDRITYYRLKLVDFDGTENYSHVIKINNSEWKGFAVLNLFPNPSEGLVNAEIYSADLLELSLEIKDVTGRIIKNSSYDLENGSNFLNFDLTTFDSGIYFFNFINKNNGKTTTLRFIKE